jgi:hypothetical protein
VFLTPEVGSLRGFFYCAVLWRKKQQKTVKKHKIFLNGCKPYAARVSGGFRRGFRRKL